MLVISNSLITGKSIYFHSKALRKEIPIQSYNDLDKSEREEVSEDFEVYEY